MSWFRTWLRTNWNGTVVPALGVGAGLLASHLGLDGLGSAAVGATAAAATSIALSPIDLLLERWESAPTEKRIEDVETQLETISETAGQRDDGTSSKDGAEVAPTNVSDLEGRVTSMDEAFPENRARGRAEQAAHWESAMRLAGYAPARVEPGDLPADSRALAEVAGRLKSREAELYGQLAMGEKTNSLTHEEASALRSEMAKVQGNLSAVEARWAGIERETPAQREPSTGAAQGPSGLPTPQARREPGGPGTGASQELSSATGEEAPRPVTSQEPVPPAAAAGPQAPVQPVPADPERQAMLEDRAAMMAAMRQQGPAEPPPGIDPDKREMMLAMSQDIGPAGGGSEGSGRKPAEPPRSPTPSPSSDRDPG